MSRYFSEVTLTRDNLLKCLEGVTDWDDLGIWLDIPSSKRTEIRNTCQNDLHCINAVVDEYLNHHPAPSWRGIAWAFYRMSKWHEKLRELYDGKRIPGTAIFNLGFHTKNRFQMILQINAFEVI